VRPSVSWLNRALADHVDRLNDALATLAVRLQDTVAQVVAQTVAGAVREVLSAPLGQIGFDSSSAYYPSLSPPPSFGSRHGNSLHEGPLLGNWHDDESDDWSEDEEPKAKPPATTTKQARWHNALAVGCQATAWWLRRTGGRCSTCLACGVGVITTWLAYAFGGGLAGLALSLIALVQVVQSGVSLLTPL
jgi:hypothetical protein